MGDIEIALNVVIDLMIPSLNKEVLSNITIDLPVLDGNLLDDSKLNVSKTSIELGVNPKFVTNISFKSSLQSIMEKVFSNFTAKFNLKIKKQSEESLFL